MPWQQSVYCVWLCIANAIIYMILDYLSSPVAWKSISVRVSRELLIPVLWHELWRMGGSDPYTLLYLRPHFTVSCFFPLQSLLIRSFNSVEKRENQGAPLKPRQGPRPWTPLTKTHPCKSPRWGRHIHLGRGL